MGKTTVAIGVAGGTGSGKTSFARAIADRVGPRQVLLLSQDAYYHDPSKLPFEERVRINYDHPDAFDTDLLVEHLDALKNGRGVPKLAYDYVRHQRVTSEASLGPRPVVILEGILVLEDERVRERLDIKLFIDTDADVRLLRRLKRDIRQRGRTLETVTKQYLDSVRPMHLAFVEPSKRHADLIVPEGAQNRVARELVVTRLRALLEASEH